MFPELEKWRAFVDKLQGRVVATNGCFDVLHAGHVKMLEAAKHFGEFLVVGINSDAAVKQLKGATRPINSEVNRAKVLSALRCVDFVCIFDSPRATDFLIAAKPHVYVKAADYNTSNLNVQEHEVLKQMNTDVRFVEFTQGLSTTSILSKI